MWRIVLPVIVAFVAAGASAQTASELYARAASLEEQARRGGASAEHLGPTCVHVYEQAARAGSGKASRRLSEIYASGMPGVPKNDLEAAKWREDARSLGEALPAAREEVERERIVTELARMEAAKAHAPGLYQRARALESEGKGAEAVPLYVRAARSGSGKAALRLGEIYEKGIPGVEPNAAESRKWFNAARTLGEPPPVIAR